MQVGNCNAPQTSEAFQSHEAPILFAHRLIDTWGIWPRTRCRSPPKPVTCIFSDMQHVSLVANVYASRCFPDLLVTLTERVGSHQLALSCTCAPNNLNLSCHIPRNRTDYTQNNATSLSACTQIINQTKSDLLLAHCQELVSLHINSCCFQNWRTPRDWLHQSLLSSIFISTPNQAFVFETKLA